MEDKAFLERLKAEHTIRKTLQNYARGSDRRDFALMRAAYHDDALDNHGPFNGPVAEYFEWAAQHHERYDVIMHMLGPANIDFVSETVAIAESYCLLIQRMRPEKTYNSEVRLHLTTACRYVDRFENRSGDWRIAERNVVYEWMRRECSAESGAPDDFPAQFLRGLRSKDDQIYAALLA